MTSYSLSTSSAGVFLVLLAVVLGLFAAAGLAAPNWDVSEVDGDGIDNDGDGYIDSEDTECGSHYEGYGNISLGGAGGAVFWVDPAIGDISVGSDPHSGTHADPCGLRKALDGPNRVVKFVSGGTITLQDSIIIRDSFVTIDGFSAPAPGVTITQTHQTHGGIYFSPYDGDHAHDYIVNHLRLDGLLDENPTHTVGWWMLLVDGDCFISGGATLGSKVSKMILDHLAIRDVQDKTTLWKCVEDVTISNCMFYGSGMALLLAGREGLYERKNLSLHHNVLAENNERNPQLRDWITNLDFVNNVIYHWAYSDWGYGIRIRNKAAVNEKPVNANIVNNYFYTSGGYQANALIYGMDAGQDFYDNGPPTCLDQGDIYTQSDMGDLWVAGNILPPANCDEYSTVTGPLPVLAWAQVTTIPADQLYTTVPQVGMQYRDVRDQGVIDRVMAAISPDVYGRHVFYNDSAFDGNDPAAGASDDAAIATDKTALLPGSTATFANYTGYAGGINGIMIDIPSLGGTPTAADFTFKVGNNSSPAGWSTAAAPTSVTVRSGAGVGGADRVSIIWANNAIQKQWLQVTVLATANTGLGAPDVSYFGNAVGETGNSASDAEVTPTDEVAVRNNTHTLGVNPATVTDTCDFTRDRKVGPTDAIICRNNGTSGSTALQLITVP